MARLVRAATDRNPPTLGGGGCQKHNASLYDVIAGARSVVELNSITILAPTPETVWEMASALPIEETL